VDENAKNMIRLAVGLCKYSENVDGFFEQSLYWSAISFEHIIHNTAKINYGIITDSKDLCEIIDELCSSNRVKYGEREVLRWYLIKLKKIRNETFHSESTFIVQEQVNQMLQGVCEMAGAECDFKKVWNETTYEQVRKLRDKVSKIKRFPLDVKVFDQKDICEADFDDLEGLYEKCKFLHFRKLGAFLSSLNLRPEEMSELIPTTGAIWLPWVLGQDVGERKHVRTVVLGVNFSPNSARIGIDFGSEAYEAKATYYTLLLDGRLNEHLTGLAAKDFCFYDTYWYFNVRNGRPIHDYAPSRMGELRLEVESALEETTRMKQEGIPMKGHQFLIGKIFARGSPEFQNFLTKMPETIKGTFSDMLGIVRQVEQHKT
jgi:hypothetical protein